MKKTQKDQSLSSLSNVPKLYELEELLDTLKITPGQRANMKVMVNLEGLTENQVRRQLSHSAIIKTNKFGLNLCLYFILFEDAKSYSLCLFNGDKECFIAYSFSKILPN